MIEWIINNKEWFLSGLGIALASILFKIINHFISKRASNENKNRTSGTHNIFISNPKNAPISINKVESVPIKEGANDDYQFYLDNKVKKVKSFAEIETAYLFQQKTITSLHLLFSLFETNISFARRRELKSLLKMTTLRQYIKDYAKTKQGKSIEVRQTTRDFEGIFEKADEIRRLQGDTKLTVDHLINAIAIIHPQSITDYFASINITWEQFSETSQFLLRRGQIDSPQ